MPSISGPNSSKDTPAKVASTSKGLDESLESALVARGGLTTILPPPTLAVYSTIPTEATHFTQDGSTMIFWRKNEPSPNLKMVLLDRWVDGEWKTETGFLPWDALRPIGTFFDLDNYPPRPLL